jgi:hypothetical protein
MNQQSALSEVTVERGPVLMAMVMDANGQRAQDLGNGRYGFHATPAYPIKTYGGYIDVNRNGLVDTGDVAMGRLVMKAENGTVVTLLSTLAQNPDIYQQLKGLGLTDEHIFNQTPSQNKVVAAVSDEVYKYCVENGISDPADPKSFDATQFASLQSAIQARILTYLAADTDVATLEQELITTELANQVRTLTQTEAEEVMALKNSGNEMTAAIKSLPTYTLSYEQKYTIAYMWDEERLARDLYLKLYELYPDAKPLYNIATQSETQHVSWVTTLVEKYDLNLQNTTDFSGGYDVQTLADIPAGQFILPELQQLYDALYAEGSQSEIDALKVGCKVEVTDVDDLDRYIEEAKAGEALDLVAVYENLRNGSYNHYWAFDNALKQRGVADGCCSLGAEFCHPEYPKQTPTAQGEAGTGGDTGQGSKRPF